MKKGVLCVLLLGCGLLGEHAFVGPMPIPDVVKVSDVGWVSVQHVRVFQGSPKSENQLAGQDFLKGLFGRNFWSFNTEKEPDIASCCTQSSGTGSERAAKGLVWWRPNDRFRRNATIENIGEVLRPRSTVIPIMEGDLRVQVKDRRRTFDSLYLNVWTLDHSQGRSCGIGGTLGSVGLCLVTQKRPMVMTAYTPVKIT